LSYSWRVAILPYIELPGLYNRYDHTAAWNSRRNLGLGPSPVAFQGIDADRRTSATSVVMVVGGAVANSERMLVAIPRSNIHWMEPRDLTWDEFLTLVRNDHSLPLHFITTDGLIGSCRKGGSIRIWGQGGDRVQALKRLMR
jgi:hypothetical protein